MPCCTAFFQSRGLPDSAPHTLLSTPPFGLRCRPPLRLARRSLLTIPPHGRRSPLVHLSSPRWNQPFPVPQLGSRLCIPSRRRSTPSALPRSQASSLFLPSPTFLSVRNIRLVCGRSSNSRLRGNPLSCGVRLGLFTLDGYPHSSQSAA